ncbi:hypothetical protein CQ055_12975 [Brucella pseudogrignonensis]|nr:hypothetical protein CQ055_12975 [Brucella pseudogrignonensis]
MCLKGMEDVGQPYHSFQAKAIRFIVISAWEIAAYLEHRAPFWARKGRSNSLYLQHNFTLN